MSGSTEVDQPSSRSDVTWWAVEPIPTGLDPLFWALAAEEAAAAWRQRLFDWHLEQAVLRATRLQLWREGLLREDAFSPPAEDVVDSD